MKQLLCFAGALLLLLTVSSCYPSLYFADRVQTTAFTDKNQFVMNGSLKPQTKPNDSLNLPSGAFSYSYDAAYSFDKNWAITGYYSNVNGRRVRENQVGLSYGNGIGGTHDGERYEIGITYFKPNRSHGVAEFSGGFSRGNIRRTSIMSPGDNFNARFNMYFAQAAYSVKTDYVVVSVGGKFWAEHFYSFEGPQDTRNRYRFRNGADISRYPFVFTNLFLNMEAGYKFIKFNTQMGMPIQLNGSSIAGFPLYITFGAVFRLEKDIFKNKKQGTTDNEN